ncbi:MAG: FAD-binding domain-containing protein, partial [Beijerinckiaceae bacterium]
ADVANNPASWQWVAGSGADAAPYFRVFNPILQGEKFDTKGDYVRRFVPELAGLPAQWIHKPWEAPAAVLSSAGITLGKTYPKPVIDHDEGRKRALAAFAALKETA